MKMNIPKIDMDPSTVAIVAGAAVIGFLLWSKLPSAGEAVTDTADLAGGLLTGNNAITKGARTNAYEGAGVLGTVGAATDRILGGVPSRVGESLGGWLYDLTH